MHKKANFVHTMKFSKLFKFLTNIQLVLNNCWSWT